MRIAVDAMGGDHAPHEIVRGVADGLRYLDQGDEIHLYGIEERIRAVCDDALLSNSRIVIRHCQTCIEMDESPVEALRHKRDSSIVRMAADAGKGELHALISAGNTGAFAAACQLKIKPIKGVTRPGIAVVMPTFHGPVLICDVGANVAPKPHHLHEYARMCTVYAETILGIRAPKIGLVSIGEEAAKGNPLVKEARQLIVADPRLSFHGNVEGRDVFAGVCHIFICDGFVGNVVLKLTEGLAEGLFKTIIKEIAEASPQLADAFDPIVDRIWKKHDFAEYGGAPLLGINNVAVICHGRSDRRAVSNAIRVAVEQNRLNLNAIIATRMISSNEVTV